MVLFKTNFIKTDRFIDYPLRYTTNKMCIYIYIWINFSSNKYNVQNQSDKQYTYNTMGIFYFNYH